MLIELSGAFTGSLAPAVSKTADVLGDLVRGGVWGALASIANLGIGYVVEKMHEAEEEAKRLKKEYDEASKRIVASAQEIGSDGADGLSRLAEEAKRAADRVVALREEFLALKAVDAKKALAFGDKAGEQKVNKEIRAKKREGIVEDARRAVMDAEDALRLAEQNERDVEDALKKVRARKYYHKGPYRDTREDGDPDVDIKPAEEAYRKAQDATAKAKATLENALTAHNTARARAEADFWAEAGEELEKAQKDRQDAEDKARAEKEKKDKEALEAAKKRKEEEVSAAARSPRRTARTSVVNVDIIIDAVGVTTLPSITINGATPTGASSPQAIYAPDGEIPEWEANAINVVSCVSVPALTAWVLLGATKLTAVTQTSAS